MKIYRFFFKAISLIPIIWASIFMLFILFVIITFGGIPDGFTKTNLLIYLSGIEGVLFLLCIYSIFLWPVLFVIGLIVKKMNIHYIYKVVFIMGVLFYFISVFCKGSFIYYVSEHWL